MSGRILLIAAIAGFAGAGLVWFSWSLLENLLAAVARKKVPQAAAATQPESDSADSKTTEKSVTRK